MDILSSTDNVRRKGMFFACDFMKPCPLRHKFVCGSFAHASANKSHAVSSRALRHPLTVGARTGLDDQILGDGLTRRALLARSPMACETRLLFLIHSQIANLRIFSSMTGLQFPAFFIIRLHLLFAYTRATFFIVGVLPYTQ